MSTITDSIDVDVDRTTAYNQWTQFEEFPMFMEGVEEVRQVSDTMLHWVTKVGPVVREYDAVITEQQPDELIAWHSVAGTDNAGRITFEDLGDHTTQITAEISVDPEGLVEMVGDKTGAIKMRVAGDLRRFKEFIEGRGGAETGAWRGTVGGDASTMGTDSLRSDTLGDDALSDGTVDTDTTDGRRGTLGGERSGYGLE